GGLQSYDVACSQCFDDVQVFLSLDRNARLPTSGVDVSPGYLDMRPQVTVGGYEPPVAREVDEAVVELEVHRVVGARCLRRVGRVDDRALHLPHQVLEVRDIFASSVHHDRLACQHFERATDVE